MNGFERRREEAEAHLRMQLMKEMSEVMRRTGLPPMVVMREAVRAIGAIYRETAQAHREPACCPCGWRPQEASDLEYLGQALLAASTKRGRGDLDAMQVLGTA
ncbi:hypothetical protein [uncultured Nitratireductor sp.]|uniref:hypothetical protein n=1 Tax=uncultured Nitratireductor sp. TaxID=520953 RepID=UPI0025EBCBD5|nr:hypothetical protein [uncultured Nitratireductor sp.]